VAVLTGREGRAPEAHKVRGIDHASYLQRSLTPAEREALLANKPVTRLLDAEPEKELANFALLTLPDQDIQALKACRVSDCDIKLSEQALRVNHL
jgi:hypothetical protein